jgi:hypothetical protein
MMVTGIGVSLLNLNPPDQIRWIPDLQRTDSRAGSKRKNYSLSFRYRPQEHFSFAG